MKLRDRERKREIRVKQPNHDKRLPTARCQERANRLLLDTFLPLYESKTNRS